LEEVSACRCSLYGLYLGGFKFFLSLLLRYSGNQLLIQVSFMFILFIRFATLLSTSILVALGLK